MDTLKDRCDYGVRKRARYFHGMLLTDRDFQEEQLYLREKLRKLNRTLWGSGVVCGLHLEAASGGLGVRIHPGLALDCSGEVIEVCKPFPVDLSHVCCQPAPKDAPCGEGQPRQREVWICIRYHERGTDPVPVYLPGGDCEKRECEYSRIEEGFCVEVLDRCPPHDTCRHVPGTGGFLASYLGEREAAAALRRAGEQDQTAPQPDAERPFPATNELLTELCGLPVPCPDCCPRDCCVVLGRVKVDCVEKRVIDVSPQDCRTWVWSHQLLRHVLCAVFARPAAAGDAGGCSPEEEHGELPDAGLILGNPIVALCHWARKKLSEEDEMDRLRAQVETLAAELETLKQEVRREG